MNKHDEAFEKFANENWMYIGDKNNALVVWQAAWQARGQADVGAVDAATANLTQGFGIRTVKAAIKALDEGVKE